MTIRTIQRRGDAPSAAVGRQKIGNELGGTFDPILGGIGFRDPCWDNVVLLIQDGVIADQSKAATTVTGNNATAGSSSWMFNGLKSAYTFGNNTSSQNSSVRFAIPNLGTNDWTIEGACSASAQGAYLFADNLGGNASGLMIQLGGGGTPPRFIVTADNDNNSGTGTTGGQSGNFSAAFPWSGYWCVERKGRYLYCSVGGIVVSTFDLGSAGYSIAAPASTPRFGQQSSVTGSWDMYMAMYRITLGVARYDGASFPVPTGPYQTAG